MIEATPSHMIEVLLIDDDPADVKLALRALRKVRAATNVQVAKDGVDAMAYLNREGAYRDAVQPDVILLDLNMPRMDGREVLESIKKDSRLKTIPIVVLSTSDADTDIEMSYSNRAISYITKPNDTNEYTKSLTGIIDYLFPQKQSP